MREGLRSDDAMVYEQPSRSEKDILVKFAKLEAELEYGLND